MKIEKLNAFFSIVTLIVYRILETLALHLLNMLSRDF